MLYNNHVVILWKWLYHLLSLAKLHRAVKAGGVLGNQGKENKKKSTLSWRITGSLM